MQMQKTFVLPAACHRIEAMAFKVFISYSSNADEQGVVWRLQTLAAAQGIQAYVPRRGSARMPSGATSWTLTAAVRKEIDDSDIVLAIITSRTDRALEAELSYAMGLKKVIIPIVYEGIRLPPLFDSCQVFWFSPSHSPGNLEAQITAYLKEQKLGKERLQAAAAIIAVAVGLLLLSAVAKE
jgi:nucleoside 2-deoxyribosyltransferase